VFLSLSVLLGSKLIAVVGNAVEDTLSSYDDVFLAAPVLTVAAGSVLEAGESVVEELVCIEMLGSSVLLGSKLTVGVAVGITLGIDDIVGDLVGPFLGLLLTVGKSVLEALACIEMLGLLPVLLGSKLTVGVVVRACLGINDIVGDCVGPSLGLLLTVG
jgi:hypothetical protein